MKTSVLAAAALAVVTIASATRADPIPAGWSAENVEPVGFTGLGGKYGAFKTAIKHAANGKWYLYMGHSFDLGWSIVDVTDPANPRHVKFIAYEKPKKGLITSQVTVHDNLMLTALNSFTQLPGEQLPAVLLWDISDPENPRRVGEWMGGPTGTHRNSYPGGKYAYLSGSYPGFKGSIMIVLDVSDPAHPKDVGKWWQPGQKEGEPPPPAGVPQGFHGPVNMSPDGTWASLPYTPSIVNLDMKDPTQPKLIGQLQMTPPFASVGIQSIHSVLPLWDRKLLFASSEAMKADCKDDGMHFAAMIDNADPAHPRLMSMFPEPVPPKGAPYHNFCQKGGRFGAHNTNQEIHSPDVEKPGNLIYIAYFNAGLRIYDISDPRRPTEVGYFMPPERPDAPEHEGAHASPINWSEEVAVDTRGNIYLNEDKWGTFVLRYKGAGQPAPTAR